MTTALDVMDILELDDTGPKKSILDREALLSLIEKKKVKSQSATLKRPEHVPREVWGLQSTLNNDLPPLIPTNDTTKYRQPKAVIGVGRVRRWIWAPFTNSARQDDLVLYHWRREKFDGDLSEDYPFARYNKHVAVPEYTTEEYEALLVDNKWSKEKTDHLMELARRFDLRFIHMRDRWDSEKFPGRPTVEDLKERYYGILEILDKARGTNFSQGLRYDAAHERLRKQQLSLLYGRTKDQVEEEQRLVQELRKIEARRKERERKKQDLQKLISQADAVVHDYHRSETVQAAPSDSSLDNIFSLVSIQPTSNVATSQRKRPLITPVPSTASLSSKDSLAVGPPGGSALLGNTSDISASLNATSSAVNSALTSTCLISFADPSKNPGVHLRSQKMKLPSNLGQKKIRIIENFLAHLQVDPSPPATAEIVEAYNNLRSKILLLYDLRLAQLHCDYELQTARMRLETFAPDQPLPSPLISVTTSDPASSDYLNSSETSTKSQIDPTILAALRDSDSKRPVVPRHSLGVAGALAAASGSSGLTGSSNDSSATTKYLTTNTTFSSRTNQSAGLRETSGGRSPSVLKDNPTGSPTIHRSSSSSTGTRTVSGDVTSEDDSLKRRRRTAAVEQGRVLKKLKIKGHLVD